MVAAVAAADAPTASGQGVTFAGSGAVNFGTANVCPSGKTTPAPCSQTATLTYNVTASGTLAAPQALTTGAPNLDYKIASGTTCTGAVTQGNTCKVNVTFAPIAPGARNGAVEIVGSSGHVLATTYIYGTGTGPAAAFDPGAYVPAGSGLNHVQGIAVDASGNVFAADRSGVQEILAEGGYATINTLGGGSVGGAGVAVDGAGNVFVANTSGVKEILRAGGYITVNTLQAYDALAGGVAVDGIGDVFITDTENSAVRELTAASGYTKVNTLGSGLILPGYIAVDGSGNVFVTDDDSTAVEEITAASGYTAVKTLRNGFTNLTAVAVDAGGNVYVADTGSNRVSEILAAGGYTTVNIVAGGLNGPTAVAVGAGGNVYFYDTTYGMTEVLRSQPPSFNFADINVGAASSPLSTTAQNAGNANLVVASLSVSPNWEQVAGSGTPADCAAGFSLVPGAECNISISFEPTETGNLTGAATLTDNALYATDATQSIKLSGTGESVEITSLNTTYGAPYSVVILNGTGFGYVQGSSTVTFNGVAASATSWGDNQIDVTVPPNASTGNVVVTVGGATSNAVLFTVVPQPVVTGISPTIGPVGTIVTISGRNLLDYENKGTVAFNGKPLPILSQSSTAIEVAIPTGAVTGDFQLVINNTDLETPTFTVAEAAITGPAPLDFGTANVCPPGKTAPAPCSQTLTLTYDVTASGPLGTPQVLTTGQPNLDYTVASGTTCTGTVTQGKTCKVNVTFAPLAPGQRNGAVEVVDGSGKILATTYIYGTGAGPLAGFSPPVARTLGSGYFGPIGIAVDASGNVFVADYQNGAIKELLAVNGSVPSNPVVKTIAEGHPNAIALDGAGNIYYADWTDRTVFEILAAGGYTASEAFGYSFGQPSGVAIDGQGNAFVTDLGYVGHGVSIPSSVKEIPAGTGFRSPKTIASGFKFEGPAGIAVDRSGNLLVADTSGGAGATGSIDEITAASGYTVVTPLSLPASDLTGPNALTLDAAGNLFVAFYSGYLGGSVVVEYFADGSQFSGPSAPLVHAPNTIEVALDGRGNVYLTDYENSLVKELELSQPPPLDFAPTAVGHVSSDSPQSIEIQNQGNSPLAATALSVSENWEQVAGSGAPEDCAASFSLAGGAQCNLSISFKPTETGPLTGAATLVDNSLNEAASMQVVPLSGTGVASLPPPQITALNTNYGAPYSVVVVTGTNFRASRGSGNVTFGGIAAPVYYWSDTKLLVTVPGNASSGNVVVTADGEASNGISFTVLPMPTLTGISPSSGPVGTVVTIRGTNLVDYENKGTVTFDGKSLPILSETSTAIEVAVPAGAATGYFHVVVNDTGMNSATFTVTP